MTEMTRAQAALTVGQVAELFGVTVRTLHHYDAIGLLAPSERSRAGYRRYTDEDLTRLRHVVVYRRLGLSLEEIDALLADPNGATSHLRRQRDSVISRLQELTQLLEAIERALEKDMTGVNLTREEQRELFGDGFSEDYAQEARQRWGDTDPWRQSQSRTAGYTKADWEAVKAEATVVNAAFAAALQAGLPATSAQAMDAAEAHRRHIHERFYALTHEFHRGLADMYVADPRFAATYEALAPGLAQYVRDAVHANADRQVSP